MTVNPQAVSPVSSLQSLVRQFKVTPPSNQPSYLHLGPPNMVDNPYFDPAFTAQNAIRKIRADLGPSGFSALPIGPPNMVDNPYFDPAFTAQNAIRKIRADLGSGDQTQVDLTRAQQIRDSFIRTGPSLSNWS